MLDWVVKQFVAALIFLSVISGFALAADNVGVLGNKPKWDVLEHYQGTITHDEFAHLINDVYCPHGIPDSLIKIDNDSAEILINRESGKVFTLRFAPDSNSKSRIPRLWRPAKSLPHAKPNKPLAGLRIALDPGHLGGERAEMGERWVKIGGSKPVDQGELFLRGLRMLGSR